VVMKARVVRHHGTRFRSATMPKHMAYLKREGVTRDGADARMFDARSDAADERAFAERCEDDRHHFRFIISPEDAAELGDLRTFTRELMTDVARDLGTNLDWVAVDHWSTDNPHVHVLIRGRAEDGRDLVISRDYISRGFRDRAAERVTLELGPRSERDIQSALEREVEAERWTSLDRALRVAADEGAGVADLRPNASGEDLRLRRLMIGRATRLERLGLADQVAPGCWTLKPGIEDRLRDLAFFRLNKASDIDRQKHIRGRVDTLCLNTLHQTFVEKQDVCLDPRFLRKGIKKRLDQFRLAIGIDVNFALCPGGRRAGKQCHPGENGSGKAGFQACHCECLHYIPILDLFVHESCGRSTRLFEKSRMEASFFGFWNCSKLKKRLYNSTLRVRRPACV